MPLVSALQGATLGNAPPVPACIFCGVRSDPVGAGMGVFWLALVAYCLFHSLRKLVRRLRSFRSR